MCAIGNYEVVSGDVLVPANGTPVTVNAPEGKKVLSVNGAHLEVQVTINPDGSGFTAQKTPGGWNVTFVYQMVTAEMGC